MIRCLFLALFLVTFVPAARAQLCSQGVKIADTCFVNPGVGCCFATNKLRYCENGITCEVDCSLGSSPKTCGWKAAEGRYACGVSTSREPSCAHPYSCHGHGCLATTNPGCCNCVGQSNACWMYEDCCDYYGYPWNSTCAYYNAIYGGCGNRVACTPSQLPGCFGCACETCVCAKDPTCCTVRWAEHCVTHCIHCGTNCPTCYPLCVGKECGDNGCDDLCGVCVGDTVCVDHKCVCAPNCVNKQCGNDGCGGVCGTCPSGWYCVNNNCTTSCLPSCGNRQCGEDGCGGVCGTCEAGFHCSPTGQCSECFSDCTGKICGDDGCGGVCGWCPGAWSCVDGQCVNNCVPICVGKQCGDDGCGGSCGVCGPNENCINHQCAVPCVPVCGGKQCGSDLCGGQCGVCPAGTACSPAFQCDEVCVPDCFQKICGEDGCGGVCGYCDFGTLCSEEGVCDPDCMPSCEGRACGNDGCGGSCGTCSDGHACVAYECIALNPGDIAQGDTRDWDSHKDASDAVGAGDGASGPDSSDVKQPLICGPGMKNQLGQCVPDDPVQPQPEAPASSGCGLSPQAGSTALLLLFLLFLGTLVMRLRPWRHPT
jgi:hypothetical protein